jgi:hypothetical protein
VRAWEGVVMQFGDVRDSILDPWSRVPDDGWWTFIEKCILVTDGTYDEREAFSSAASVELMINAT